MVLNFARRSRALLVLIRNVVYDLVRYYSAAASNAKRMNDPQLRARLFQRSHSIEKGLAMPNIRPGFGIAPLKELNVLLREYEKRGLSIDDVSYLSAKHAITAYVEYHTSRSLPIPADVKFLSELTVLSSVPQIGGVVELNAIEQMVAGKGDFDQLSKTRRSARMFSPQAVDYQDIRAAVEIAARSPSVCNRQAGRVRVIEKPELLKQVLELQGGNRGFGSEIPCVLLVTCYLGLFRGARERNQCWIDGGLFSMTLLYALTFKQYATCPLNWSSDYKQDKELRRMLDLPDDEVVIMLIATGKSPDNYRVASSARRSIDDVLLKTY